VDHALGLEVNGPVVALLALAAGVGGSALMTRPDSSQPEAAASTPGDPAATPAPTAA
jgi:hypothetical protein